MSNFITVEAKIDLNDYRDEIEEWLKPNYHSDLSEYVREMEKNLYLYPHRGFKSYEQIYEDLKRIVEEN